MAIKIDLRKVFDSMKWQFLHKVINAWGFNDKFIQLVLSWIHSTSFSISLNVKSFKYFKLNRGLREGDPLLPYLFIMCKEVLSRLLEKKETFGYFKELKLQNHHNLFPIYFIQMIIWGSKTLERMPR